MGTYYAITLDGGLETTSIKNQIDSLLGVINDEASTYITSSVISQINQASSGDIVLKASNHFWTNAMKAVEWHDKSDGYLDASIMPLVNYWGFGYTPKKAVTQIDSIKVDSLTQFVGLEKWKFDLKNKIISKSDSRLQLDFSAIAKGYAVDQIGTLLSASGSDNYYIDIGGECIAKGLNPNGKVWRIGVSTPTPESQMTDITTLIKLENAAVASSGNYRNYHEVNGRKYGHTISPFTGYPYQDSLLQVSVITEKCVDADAIATACMAMGYDKATTFINELDNVTACFIIGKSDGSISTTYADGFIRYATETH